MSQGGKSDKEFLSLLKEVSNDKTGYSMAKFNIKYDSSKFPEFWEYMNGGTMKFHFVSKAEHRIMTVYRKEFLAWYHLQK